VPERTPHAPVSRGPDAIEPEGDLPPVVARMVIEIRSDGTRTIARGAVEDRVNDHTVAIEADGRTPWELSRKLLGALVSLPSLARTAARALESSRKRKR
jgi:hypothetical protein